MSMNNGFSSALSQWVSPIQPEPKIWLGLMPSQMRHFRAMACETRRTFLSVPNSAIIEISFGRKVIIRLYSSSSFSIFSELLCSSMKAYRKVVSGFSAFKSQKRARKLSPHSLSASESHTQSSLLRESHPYSIRNPDSSVIY